MQPHKSLTELEQDREIVLKALQNESIDDAEKSWYKKGLASIEEAIRLKKASMQNPPPKNEPQQPQQLSLPKADNIRELKTRVIGPVSNDKAMPNAKRRDGLGRSLSNKDRRDRAAWKLDAERQGANYAGTGAAETDTTITAETLAMLRKVKIEWEDGRNESLMEGQVRSRFVTTLRDLVKSRYAEEKRWDAIEQYVSFSRAVTYYRALRIFWNGDPSADQLRIQLGGTKEIIFRIIVKSAQDDNAEA